MSPTPEQPAKIRSVIDSLDQTRDKLMDIAGDEPIRHSPSLKVVNDAIDTIDHVRAMLELLGSGGDSQPASMEPDWQLYLDRYDDVRSAGSYSEQWAWRHYQEWGREEGRVWGAIESTQRRRFHHYNASAWHDRGVAVILCPGDRAESASIGGHRLHRHGNLDKGREVWADYHRRGLVGVLELVIGGVSHSTEITDAEGMTRGDCWGDDR